MLMKLYICMGVCLFSRFMSIVLWPGMTHLVPRLSQNVSCGWGAWCYSLSFETFPFFNQQTAGSYIISSYRLAGGGGGTLSAPFWCLCQKLSLSLLYFNKTLLHRSSEQSSLVSGPGLNSSPEAKNPGVFRGPVTAFQNPWSPSLVISAVFWLLSSNPSFNDSLSSQHFLLWLMEPLFHGWQKPYIFNCSAKHSSFSLP